MTFVIKLLINCIYLYKKFLWRFILQTNSQCKSASDSNCVNWTTGQVRRTNRVQLTTRRCRTLLEKLQIAPLVSNYPSCVVSESQFLFPEKQAIIPNLCQINPVHLLICLYTLTRPTFIRRHTVCRVYGNLSQILILSPFGHVIFSMNRLLNWNIITHKHSFP